MPSRMHRPVGWPEFPTRKTVEPSAGANPCTATDDRQACVDIVRRQSQRPRIGPEEHPGENPYRSAKKRLRPYPRTERLGTTTVLERIEPVEYGLLRPLIEHDIASGGHHFSPDRPKLYERTSGSGGVAKFIPYDKALQKRLRQDVFASGPRPPEIGLKLRAAGVSHGDLVADRSAGSRDGQGAFGRGQDTDYLHASLAMLLKPFMVAPALALALREPGEFKDVVVASLLAAHDLEVVSIWNPAIGSCCSPCSPAGERLEPGGVGRNDAWRSAVQVLTGHARPKAKNSSSTGPGLERRPGRTCAMSCWADAEAVGPASVLARQFPGVRIQGKRTVGDRSTITVPMAGAISPVRWLTMFISRALAARWQAAGDGKLA